MAGGQKPPPSLLRHVLIVYPVVHIQIPPTGYVGLILGITAVATASRSTVEGTMEGILMLLHV